LDIRVQPARADVVPTFTIVGRTIHT
jgi:hypothetical protein